MKIVNYRVKSNAYFHRVVLFRIPTNDANFWHDVECAYFVTHSWFDITPYGKGQLLYLCSSSKGGDDMKVWYENGIEDYH